MNLMRKAAPVSWFFMAILCAVVLLVGAGAWFFISIPDAKDLKDCLTTQMYSVPLCKNDSNYVQLKSISTHLRNAVVASEDAAFWDHQGLDWVELRRSFETNLEKGRMARGGSTITQQLAKNVYLSPEKSLLRKIREAVIAIRIERQYDKNFILEKYLNVVEFDAGVYGVKRAAQHYFGTTPAGLSIAQSAWLAFLLPSPKKYSVSFHKNKLTPFAFRQMKEIIERLARFKRITDDQKVAAIREARAFFGGLSGESKELEEEFDRDGGSEEEAFESAPGESATTAPRRQPPEIPTLQDKSHLPDEKVQVEESPPEAAIETAPVENIEEPETE